ncbi:hypothetical protein EON66_02320 [archaeon]|nr:MAG: hypothetical protein EON66_02320 [archaeon]
MQTLAFDAVARELDMIGDDDVIDVIMTAMDTGMIVVRAARPTMTGSARGLCTHPCIHEPCLHKK